MLSWNPNDNRARRVTTPLFTQATIRYYATTDATVSSKDVSMITPTRSLSSRFVDALFCCQLGDLVQCDLVQCLQGQCDHGLMDLGLQL
jgi:hypothetical protein